jgi:hypothetical protein
MALAARISNPRILRRLVSLAVLVATGVASVFVFHGSNTIKPQSAEKFAQRTLQQWKVKGSVKSVTCPSGVHPRAGVSFRCFVHFQDGSEGVMRMHVLDRHGDTNVSPSDYKVVTVS